MAGTITTIMPKRLFDFTTLPNGASATMMIAEEIDISQYIDGILIVRVHDISMTGGQLSFQLIQDGFCERDPALAFQAPPSIYFNTAAFIDSTLAAGQLVAGGGRVGGFIGEYVALTVFAQRLFTAPAPIIATVSADLLMRSPDDSDGKVSRAVAEMGGCRCM